MINKLKRNEQLHKGNRTITWDDRSGQISRSLEYQLTPRAKYIRKSHANRFAIQSQSSVCDLHTHLYANRIGMSAKRFNFIAQQRKNCNRGERESGKWEMVTESSTPLGVSVTQLTVKRQKIPRARKKDCATFELPFSRRNPRCPFGDRSIGPIQICMRCKFKLHFEFIDVCRLLFVDF